MAQAMVEVGKKAPAFTLKDGDGNKVGLKDFQGEWVVLYFYPKDDTPGCTTEAIEFSKLLAKFTKADTTVLGISPDSCESHAKFAAKHKLKVTLLSDPDHKALAPYGAWGLKKNYGREYEGVIRSTFIINPEGKVAHRWKSVKAKGHAEKVIEKVQQLQA